MNAGSSVEITDRDGWCRIFPLEKPLIHIGSDPRSDIVLQSGRGGGVAARHLQLITIPGHGYRAINLGEENVLLGESGDKALAPHSVIDIADGECFRLGEFRLTFRLGGALGTADEAAGVVPRPRPVAAARPVAAVPAARAPAPAAPRPVPRAQTSETIETERVSAAIGLKLSLPQAALDPECPLEGVVTVRNLGREPGVQFRLEVHGLDADCYEIGPGPILFPDVEKAVYLRLYHPRRPGLTAGRHEIRISAAAPEAYPGESVTVTRQIEVLPYYKHVLSLVPVD
jgi:hypothetical protein